MAKVSGVVRWEGYSPHKQTNPHEYGVVIVGTSNIFAHKIKKQSQDSPKGLRLANVGVA